MRWQANLVNLARRTESVLNLTSKVAAYIAVVCPGCNDVADDSRCYRSVFFFQTNTRDLGACRSSTGFCRYLGVGLLPEGKDACQCYCDYRPFPTDG